MQTFTRTTPRAATLIVGAVAAATTLTLFSAVVSISEPQRSELMAKTHQAERMAAARVAPVAMALVATPVTKR